MSGIISMAKTSFRGKERRKKKKKVEKEENSAFEVSAHRDRRLSQGGGKSSGLTCAVCFKGATDGGSHRGMLRLDRLDPEGGPHLSAKNRFSTIAWPHSRLPACMAFSKTPPKPNAIAVVCSRGTLSLIAIVVHPEWLRDGDTRRITSTRSSTPISATADQESLLL